MFVSADTSRRENEVITLPQRLSNQEHARDFFYAKLGKSCIKEAPTHGRWRQPTRALMLSPVCSAPSSWNAFPNITNKLNRAKNDQVKIPTSFPVEDKYSATATAFQLQVLYKTQFFVQQQQQLARQVMLSLSLSLSL